MESKKDLSIKTVPVEVRVLTVDGKRMTKSVMDQIQDGDGLIYEFIDSKFIQTSTVLGWVKVPKKGRGTQEYKVLMYSKDGVLYKTAEKKIRKFGLSDLLCNETPPSKIMDNIEVAGTFPRSYAGVSLIKWVDNGNRFRQILGHENIRDRNNWENSEGYTKAVQKVLELSKLLPPAMRVFDQMSEIYTKSDIEYKIEDIFRPENQIFISI